MKKIFLKFFKIILVLVLLIIIVGGIVYYNSVNYKTYNLEIDRSSFSNVKTDADIDKLAVELVSQMTFKEKVDQMYAEKMTQAPKMLVNFMVKNRFPHVYAGGNERLKIPPWVLSDGPRGARVMDKSVNGVTTFPVAMARGASWDVELEERINEVIAIEMRANGTNYAATPCINLLRHPAWGRSQETYGEDPYLLGEFGVAAVNGIQRHNVMACPKHFALNSIENSRWVVDVELDERTLREVYLPHFKKTVQKGKPASIMSAYNLVRGEYCGNNKELLTDILRNDWGFQGFVSSDWVNGVYDGVASVKAGLDVEMPWQNAYSYDNLTEGIEAGEITEKDIDKLVLNSLGTRLKYAFAEDRMDYSVDLIANKEHVELAKITAEESMVLLKNVNTTLPFSNKINKKIAVIGKLANTVNTGDHGSSDSTPPYVITPYQGIKNYQGSFGNEVILNDGSNIESAKKLAAEVDEVIVVVGYTFEDEGEYMILSRDRMVASAEAGKAIGEKGVGGDRESLKLHYDEEQLISSLAEINSNMAVVYIGGSAVDMSNWENQVPAILFAWYSGMEGGNALANILYGKVNPSGKLPFSIAKNEKDYPPFNPYTNKITYGYYHGYTLFDKENIAVAYPFGFGLSYTDYEYSNLVVQTKSIDQNGTVVMSVDVKNSGETAGKEIVEVYIGFKNSSVNRPVKLLKGFKKVLLGAGETKTVSFEILANDLAWYNPNNKSWQVENMQYEIYVGGSSIAEDLLKDTFFIEESQIANIK